MIHHAPAVVAPVKAFQQIRHAFVAVRTGRRRVRPRFATDEAQLLPLPQSRPMWAIEVLSTDPGGFTPVQKAEEKLQAGAHGTDPTVADTPTTALR